MRHISRRCRRGFTLVEMLIAMGITIILIMALSQAFAVVGETVALGRAAIEMSGNLRAVTHRLEEDLNGLTVPVRPWADETVAPGYFEIVDGTSLDKDGSAIGAPETGRGDIDDYLAFTARSREAPFTGTIARVTTESISSPLAEVVWWIQRTDTNANGTFENDEPFSIYRRALLIRPDLPTNVAPFAVSFPNLAAARTGLVAFLSQNDISVRIEQQAAAVWKIVPNSLTDLTLRQNRFAHQPVGSFPHALDTNVANLTSLYYLPKTGAHLGEDVMVSNALAFDVQVFDAIARMVPSPNTGEVLVPSDPGYWAAVSPQPLSTTPPDNAIAYGTYVDLGYGQRQNAVTANWSNFSGLPNVKSRLNNVAYTYCTWATYYERDGVDQDGVYGADQGFNGFDDDNANGVDDAGELETAPPYPRPLRGIQVRIRAWDPDSRQVRQATVATDFVPE